MRDTASRFADYVGLVSDALGDLVEDWTTLNEPWVASFMGTATASTPPGAPTLETPSAPPTTSTSATA